MTLSVYEVVNCVPVGESPNKGTRVLGERMERQSIDTDSDGLMKQKRGKVSVAFFSLDMQYAVIVASSRTNLQCLLT